MIKFFRRIRYDLMEKNKTGKPAWPVGRYFKYAFGEIVLVVIGILIALQLNNWNEARKLNDSLLAYLDNLKKEVVQNDMELKIKIDQHKLLDDNLIELASLMDPNPASITRNKLDTLVIAMTFMPVYNPIKTFTNSDNLQTIENTELKKLISLWNFELEGYTYDTTIIYDLYYNAIYPFVEENYQLKILNYNRLGTKASSFPINAPKLLSSSVFENQVTMKLINNGNAYEQLLILAKLHQQIIQLIDQIILKNQ